MVKNRDDFINSVFDKSRRALQKEQERKKRWAVYGLTAAACFILLLGGNSAAQDQLASGAEGGEISEGGQPTSDIALKEDVIDIDGANGEAKDEPSAGKTDSSAVEAIKKEESGGNVSRILSASQIAEELEWLDRLMEQGCAMTEETYMEQGFTDYFYKVTLDFGQSEQIYYVIREAA